MNQTRSSASFPMNMSPLLLPRGKSFGGAGFGFGGFFGAVLGRGGSFEGVEEAQGDASDFVDGGVERRLIGLGRGVEAGDFPDELERSRADVLGTDWRIEVIERFDVSAHDT
jgi:hypothetical protein